jgi:Zn-dependent protease with chaperone function
MILVHRWQSLRRRTVLHYAKTLFDDVAERQLDVQLQTHLRATPGLVCAYAIAGLVWSANLLLAVVGALLLWRGGGHVWQWLLGISLLTLAWLARPRLVTPPEELIERSDFPTLHDVCDHLAHALNAPKLRGIGLSADFNANYRHAGWPSNSYIEIGAGLLLATETEEQLAILAHELSHGANGDPLRGQFLYGAVNTLARWGSVIRPLSIGRSMDGVPFAPIAALLAIPIELLQLMVSELLLLAAQGLLVLVARQSQRAEYLADLIASKATGKRAAIRAMEKLCMYDAFDAALNRHALTQPEARLPWPIVHPTQAERSAALTAAREEQTQVDASHPPTSLRIDMLERQGSEKALFTLDAEQAQAFEAEIARLIASKQRAVIDRKLVQIYG